MDSLSLFQALNNKSEYHNELGIFLADIRELLRNFPDASVTYVSHKYNFMSHNLAKHALQVEDEISWLEEIHH